MISRRTLFGKAVLEWMNSSACISNRGGGIRFNFTFKNLEVKGGVVTVLQLLTYNLSLELFSLSSVRIHIRMANFTRVSVFPGAAPVLNSSGCHIHMEARARRVNVVT